MQFSGDVNINDDFAEVMDMIMIKQAQFLQKMVKEIDTMKLAVLEGGDTEGTFEEEEIPPLPDSFLNQKPLTPEEEEAKKVYESAMLLLNRTKPDKKQAYGLLEEAAARGNNEAKALIAWANLFGNPLKQDLEKAKEIFTYLAETGNPDGHMGLGEHIQV